MDYETLSRDTSMLGKEMDAWVGSLPAGDGAGVEGHVEGGVIGGAGSLYDGESRSNWSNRLQKETGVMYKT